MKARRKSGEGCVYLRGNVWWIKYRANGEPQHETSGSEKESDARRLLKKRLGEIALGRFVGPDAERVTIRELWEDYLNDYRVNDKKSIGLKRANENQSSLVTVWLQYGTHWS